NMARATRILPNGLCYRIAYRHLDLRNPMRNGQGGDQVVQRFQKVGYLLWQHMTNADIGNKAAFALVKAQQHPTLRRHEAYCKTRAMPVRPLPAVQRRKNLLGLQPRDTMEC